MNAEATIMEATDQAQAEVPEFVCSIPELMEYNGVVGLAMALIDGARLRWVKGFGVKNLKSKGEITGTTVFEAGSLSKPVFAYAALGLYQKGALDLDRPLADYLSTPYMPDEPWFNSISARHVLSHTTGLENWRSRNSALGFVAQPGRQFTYSGEGYVYLQRVVEHLVGQSLTDFMQEQVLEPLGLRDSSYNWRGKYETEAAHSYTKAGKIDYSLMRVQAHHKVRIQEPQLPEFASPNAAAGLWMTPIDFASFMVRIIQPSSQESSYLSESTLMEMLKPQVNVASRIHWGLGWGIQLCADDSYFFHWASHNSFQHFAIGSRQQGRGVLIMTNSANGSKTFRTLIAKTVVAEPLALRYIEF